MTQISLKSIRVLVFCCVAGVSLWASPRPVNSSQFDPVQVVSATPATYPMLSIASGTVILQVRVNETGAIDKIDVTYGIPSLTEQAERSVRQWKFKPAIVDGKPLASDLVASFSFSRPLPIGPALRLTATPGEQAPSFEPIKVVSAIQAVYPATSAFGTVILQVNVGSSGAIESVKVIHDIMVLTEAAKRAMKEWEFEPARLDGKPVASSMIASFTFAASPLTLPNR